MKAFNLLFLIFLVNSAAFTQEARVSGYIYDSATGKGINGAHIYWECSPTQGTISNEDGRFILPEFKDHGSLIISHIGYTTVQYDITRHNEIAIAMSASSYELSEINVTAMGVSSIINNVISKLEENHPNFPVYYSFFHREVYFSKDSTIHLIEEHTGVVEHRTSAFTYFINEVLLYKSRIGYFSNEGKDKFERWVFVPFTRIILDNPFFDRYDHLHKRRSRHFEYRLVGKRMVNEHLCYVIDFKTDKSTTYPMGRLYIDAASFAIVKEKLRTGRGSEVREIYFVESKGLWYLNNAEQYRSTPSGPSYRITLYNAISKKEIEGNFTTMGELLPNYVKEKATNFDDNYWGEHNIVPLPDWILKRIIKPDSALETK